MKYNRQEAAQRLLDSYRTYYNITGYQEGELPLPLLSLGEYYETAQQYILHRKAEVWSANCEEFLYMFSTAHLTADECRRMLAYAQEDGMQRAHIGKGHMYTYITPLILCDTAEEEAIRLLKKCRTYRSFLFSIHGWMEMHTAVLVMEKGKLYTNPRGKCLVKNLRGILAL